MKEVKEIVAMILASLPKMDSAERKSALQIIDKAVNKK